MCATDGHGGKDVSKYMKDHFYKAFENTLFHSISGASASASSDATTDCVVSNALKKALSAVDDDILTGPTSRKLHYQGSTSCMLYLEKSGSQDSPFTSVVSANVGDSRAVMARGLKSVELTEDHKPNDPLERQRGELAPHI
jgi:serine/threonine protein phosphatase PrpC